MICRASTGMTRIRIKGRIAQAKQRMELQSCEWSKWKAKLFGLSTLKRSRNCKMGQLCLLGCSEMLRPIREKAEVHTYASTSGNRANHNNVILSIMAFPDWRLLHSHVAPNSHSHRAILTSSKTCTPYTSIALLLDQNVHQRVTRQFCTQRFQLVSPM